MEQTFEEKKGDTPKRTSDDLTLRQKNGVAVFVPQFAFSGESSSLQLREIRR